MTAVFYRRRQFFPNIRPRTNYFSDDLNSSILVHLAIQLTDFSLLSVQFLELGLFLHRYVLYSKNIRIHETKRELVDLDNLANIAIHL